jgi:hypothetical protein
VLLIGVACPRPSAENNIIAANTPIQFFIFSFQNKLADVNDTLNRFAEEIPGDGASGLTKLGLQIRLKGGT